MLGLLFSKTSFKILQIIGVAFVLLYAHDYLFKKPIRDVTAIYEVKINELNDEVVTKNQALKIEGTKLNGCYKDLQEFIDKEKSKELDLIFSEITNTELVGANDENITFSIYNYSY